MKTERKLHYAWIIALVSGLLMFGMSAQQMSASIFIYRVADSLGVGMGTISLAYSSSTFFMLIMTPLNAKLYTKYPVRVLAILTVVDQVLSLLLLSVAQNVWMVAAACILECFSVSSILNIMPSVLIKRWFKDKGQFAYNVILFISMLGGVCFTPIANRIILASSWRVAYRSLIVYVILVELPAVLFLLKEYPAQKGLSAYEDPDAGNQQKFRTTPTMNADVTAKTCWKNKYFYLCCIYSVFFAYSAAMNNHLVKHLISVGYDSELGTRVVTAGLVAALIGRVILAFAGEKFSIKVTNTVYCALGILSCVFLWQARGMSPLLILLFGAIFGMVVKVSTVQTTTLRYKVFGASEDYTQILANMHVITNVITATSGTVYGYMYDHTGSYSASFILAIVSFAISIVMCFIILKDDGKKAAA